jgi:hypothetical protein
MPYFSKPFLCVSSVLKSRRALACAMLGFVFEALCVLGRAPGPIELRTPLADAAFVMIERPKNRTAIGLQAMRHNCHDPATRSTPHRDPLQELSLSRQRPEACHAPITKDVPLR